MNAGTVALSRCRRCLHSSAQEARGNDTSGRQPHTITRASTRRWSGIICITGLSGSDDLIPETGGI